MKAIITGLLAATAMLAVPAAAQTRTASGIFNGTTWQAQSRVVGTTSTATAAGGGNPIYFAAQPQYSGVVSLIMNYGAAGSFICSGTLMNDRRSIVTAAHCVTDATLSPPISTTAFFYGGPDPDTVVHASLAATGVAVATYHVEDSYTGEVIDQNDIAVLRLADLAPAFATSFDLSNEGDLTGDLFNIAGYGRRTDTGGNVGANLGVGRLRQGDNRFDFRLGDDDFGGFFDGGPAGFFGTAETEFSYLSDFDNGLAANDASCLIADAFGLGGAKYCNLGVGALEVSTAGGDSGGPQFINGKLASVTSYGLSFGTGFGDVGGGLNSSFGEFNGFVPISIHENFIRTVMAVPEPSTWAMMIVGFGLVGGSMRRRRSAGTPAIA